MAETPFFSIIVPTHGRPRRLAACLQSLMRLDYSAKRWEVIVVDDGSQTPAERVVEPFRNRLDVTLLRQERAGPAAARNAGVARARGDFVAFTDDDCAPVSSWLQKLAARFARKRDCVIGGWAVNTLPQDPYCKASQLLLDYLCSYYNSDPDQAQFLLSNNLALPRDLFHALGGFDTTFRFAGGEDRELCDRCLFQGHQLIYAAEVLVYHTQALTLLTFCRQHFNYGRGAFRFHQLRTDRGSTRMRLEPLSFYRNLVSYPFRRAGENSPASAAALLVVSQVANVLGFLWQSINQRKGAAKR